MHEHICCSTSYLVYVTTLHIPAASNLGPLSAYQRNAIRMAFCWRADTGPILRAYWAAASIVSKTVQSSGITVQFV